MYKFLALIIFTLFIVSCTRESSGRRYRLFDNQKAISFDQNSPYNPFTFIDGEYTVFNYAYNHPQNDDIADDELTEAFAFTIPAGLTSFEFTSEDIVNNPDLSLAYARLCFCGYITDYEPIAFSASGKKISNTKWEVKFDVTFKSDEYEFPLSDDGIYYISEF
jgi:hypothetical protein